jgi:Tat protein secretion system quality control protein TatD with DNase activity
MKAFWRSFERSVFVAMILVMASLTAGCVAAISDYVRTMPLFDAHNHLQYDESAEMLVKWMDEAGVRRMALIPRHYKDDGGANDEMALAFAQRFPDRFIAFIGGQRGDLWPLSAWYLGSFILEAEPKAKSGKFQGLGEFIILHYGYNKYVSTTHQNISGDQRLPLNTPLMNQLFQFGQKSGLPLLIHAEAEPDMSQQMWRMLQEWPKTKVIWAHNCGRAPASQVAEFLRAFPQLTCDLAGMSVPMPNPFGWGTFNTRAGNDYRPNSHVTRIQENDGTINLSMRDLFEQFPDRFMIGTDIAHPFAYSRYKDVIIAFRRLLSQLSPETARKIGKDNAERLFGPAKIP